MNATTAKPALHCAHGATWVEQNADHIRYEDGCFTFRHGPRRYFDANGEELNFVTVTMKAVAVPAASSHEWWSATECAEYLSSQAVV